MKTHYSAKELAGLPGLPNHYSSIIRKADREQWDSQPRKGNGGGLEYAFTSLPVITQRHLQKTALETAAANLPAVKISAPAPAVIKPLPAPADLTKHQTDVMNARLFLVLAIQADMALGHRWNRSVSYIAQQIALGIQPFAGQAELANDRKRKTGEPLKERSLVRFWSDWKNSGENAAALAPNDADVKRVQSESALIAFVRDFGTRSDRGLIPAGVPAWLPYFLAGYRKPSSPSIVDALREMGRTMPQQLEMPTYWQVTRIVKKLPVVYIEKGRKTGAELKALMGFNRRVWSEYHPFTVGQIDGHSFKAYVAHPVTGAHFHPEVCGLIDMTTKILAGWSAGLAESSRTVADAYRHACTVNEQKPWGGVFFIIEADLGSGNKAIVNADKEIGLFKSIGTTMQFPEVAGNPQGHGGIERSNQSIWIRAAKELPTYTGKDMDRVTRKRIYTKLEQDLKAVKKAGELGKVEKTSKLLLSWREFVTALEIWVSEYNNTPHSALPKISDPVTGRRRHRTPFEELAHRINEGWDPQSIQLDKEMLEHQFMPQQLVKIDRCEFRLHGNRYHSYELHTHHGEEMIAAYDIHDPHQVFVLNREERLICIATWNGNNIHGIPVSKMEQADIERTVRRTKLKERQLDMILAEKATAVIIEHAPELQAKRLAFTAQITGTEAPAPAAAAPRRKVVPLHTEAPVGFVIPDDRRERWDLWCRLNQRVKDEDDTLLDEEIRFYTSFRNSATWRSFKMTQAQ